MTYFNIEGYTTGCHHTERPLPHDIIPSDPLYNTSAILNDILLATFVERMI